MAKYFVDVELPPAPQEVAWQSNVHDWGMMLNDQLGDCTCAGAGHLIQSWSAAVKPEFVPADADILQAYKAVSGYNGNANTDNGAVELDVLKYWKGTGIALHQIAGFASLDPQNDEHTRQAIWLFGGIYIGLALPQSAQDQIEWDVSDGFWQSIKHVFTPALDPTPGSWGGHAVPVLGYDSTGLTCITWGEPLKMTWAFYHKYCDEAYAVLSPDWLQKDSLLSPCGFKLDQLKLDLAGI